jgi:hypothetical protein
VIESADRLFAAWTAARPFNADPALRTRFPQAAEE